MVNIEKSVSENLTKIDLIFENSQLSICYAGNLDLYFLPYGKMVDDEYNFNINIEDWELYELFSELYNKVINYMPYDNGEVDERFKAYDEEKKIPLVSSGIIRWYSDDYEIEEANFLEISKDENVINIKIKINFEGDMFPTRDVRIRTSGSRYGHFFVPFMHLYLKLKENDFNYHQVTTKEYMLTLNKKGEKNEK